MNRTPRRNKTAERIYMLRREKHISQMYLAEKLGVSRSLVSLWERGSGIPTVDKIRTMAMLFGVSADYICGASDNRHDIKIPGGSEIDLTRLNSAGIQILYSIYKLMINSDEYKLK